MTRKASKQGGKKQRARAGSGPLFAPQSRSLNTQTRGWVVPAICLGLLALTWVVFGQTLRFAFVNYDDNDYVYDNPNITNGLTWTGIRWAFTQFHADNWHPLTTVSHMLDCQFYGLRPWGHHLTNILLHATAAILLFLALQRLTGGSRSHRNESMPSPRPGSPSLSCATA